MSRWMRRGAMVIAALVVTAAVTACSDDAGETMPSSTVATTTTSIAPSTSTTTTTTTVPASTTTTESSSMVPQATEPPPPSDPVTTTSLPEGVPPRVTFPDDPDKQAVVDAAYAFYDAANAAARRPDGELERVHLREVATEPIESRLFAFLDELVANQERVAAGTGTAMDVYPVTVEITGTSATLDVCSVDTDARVRSEAGVDTVVDETVTSWNQTYELVSVDGRWRVADIVRFAIFEGRLGCDAD